MQEQSTHSNTKANREKFVKIKIKQTKYLGGNVYR